jgi:hypothetical protein
MSSEGRRPIPVRDLVGGKGIGKSEAAESPARGAPEGPGGEPTPPSAEPEIREFDVAGARWRARVVGRTRTGDERDAGAVLLALEFDRVNDPTGPSGREALAVARTLDELDDHALEELLARSRPRPPEGGVSK